MLPTVTNRTVLILSCLVAIVGAVDAAVGDKWDLVAVFAMAFLLQLVLLVRLSARRPSVPIRADLVRWLRDRAADEGDDAGLIADRALAAYRADLLGGRGSDVVDG